MTTYKDIRGTHITTVTTDPPAPVNGQMWYNSTSKVIKGFTSNPAGSWATGADLNTGRAYMIGAGNSVSSILGVNGQGSPGSAVNNNESWNGSSWTEVADTSNAREICGGAGASNTSALVYGDLPASGVTESWNGSAWSEVADLNNGRGRFTGTGIQTAAIACGGETTGPPNVPKANVETWNGSAWTETTDLNTNRQYVHTGGTYTSALTAGGLNPPGTTLGNTESWNGSTWTEVADVATPAGQRTVFGQDNENDLAVGNGLTESWNGTAWTEVNDINTQRGVQGSGRSPSGSGLIFGGPPGAGFTATEEWTAPATSTVTFTAS
jgi:hypothetical protein